MDTILARLKTSRFRASFTLRQKERDYLARKGMDEIKKEAYEFIRFRLAPALPKNDGKQTPIKIHPVFIAQHATATCCRKCLEKWHNIPQGIALTSQHIDFIVTLIMAWLQAYR